MRPKTLIAAALTALVLSACTPVQEQPTAMPGPVASTQEPSPQATEPTAPAEEPSPEPTGESTTSIQAGSALEAAQRLTVKGRAANTGYERDLFGDGWLDTDGNGCDTRNDILLRDLTSVALSSDGCTVLSGVLNDPFTGKVINFQRGRQTSSAVQVDHVYPLSLAWQQGAQQWDDTKRRTFANDPLNLLAVDGPTNGSKSDSGPGSWLPPNKTFRCAYVARFVAVTDKYDLSVNPGDHGMILDVLSGCPDEPLPTDDSVPTVASVAPAPEPAPVVDNPAPAKDGLDPDYGTCKAAKAAGANVPYVKGVDPEYEYYRDGDGDGTVCE